MREFIATVFGKHLTRFLLRRSLSATITLSSNDIKVKVGFTYKPDHPDNFTHEKFLPLVSKVIACVFDDKDAQYFTNEKGAMVETVTEIERTLQEDELVQAFCANIESVTIKEISFLF